MFLKTLFFYELINNITEYIKEYLNIDVEFEKSALMTINNGELTDLEKKLIVTFSIENINQSQRYEKSSN